MKVRVIQIALIGFCLIGATDLSAQIIKFEKSMLEAIQVSMSIEQLMGKNVVRVIADSAVKQFDEPTYVKIKGVEFKHGTIEAKVLSRLLPNASPNARGFIGVAFRINDTNSTFECFYIRPTNGRDTNQIRRNHSTQYFSYPDYKFDRLRKESPEQYESYADMGLNEWVTIKIVVNGAQAMLFINNNKQPTLIVNDLKHGADSFGNVGLWVGEGTEGFFTDLQVQKKK